MTARAQSMEPTPLLRDHIRELEEQFLMPDVRQSRHKLSRLLANEFVAFASDGAAYNKEQVIEALQREASYRRTLTEFRIVALGENVVLATYRVTRQDDTLHESVDSMRSSIWRQHDGHWQLLFHQGTTCRALNRR